MFIDWIHWLSSIHPDQLILLLVPLLLMDAPRYSLGVAALWTTDFAGSVVNRLRGVDDSPRYTQCPSVCVVVAGLNEAETIGHAVVSLGYLSEDGVYHCG